MHLYHFSEDPNINLFVPRPVLVPVERPAGFGWLNGPLVWAIDEAHEVMYLFPRDCPRILLWATPDSTSKNIERWWRGSSYKTLAYVEKAWLGRLQNATIYRYELPTESFENLHDAGMWVSKEVVELLRMDVLNNLMDELENHEVELRVVDSLVPLKEVWRTSLHGSGIRLRNAQGWGKPGWTHSKKGRVVEMTEPD